MIKSIIVISVVVYFTIVAALYVLQRNLMYHPGADAGTPITRGLPEMTPFKVTTADGIALESWHAPPQDTGKTVVLFHGNAGTIGDRGDKARYFLDAGYGLVLVGYRGFGGNPGKPSEEGLYADADAILEWLRGNGVSGRDIVLFGESLGTAMAVYAADRQSRRGNPVSAVILESPFTSMGDAAAVHYPWLPARLLVRDRYDSLSRITSIEAPLLVIHGERDRTVPVDLGRSLFDAAREPKKGIWLPDAGHVDLFDHGLAPKMLGWLRKVIE